MHDRTPLPARLLQDAESRNLVEAARDHQEEKQSLKRLASNMVSMGQPTHHGRRIGVGAGFRADWNRWSL